MTPHNRNCLRLVASIAAICGLFPLVANSADISFSDAIPYTAAGDADSFFDASWPVLVEDFEDNDTDSFISFINGQILPPNFGTGTQNLTDSVDGDDGTLDGNGNNGYSFFNSGRSIMVTFAEPATKAGLVWTDGDPNSAGVMLEAFDANGLSLGTFEYGDLGDDDITGQTAEDRFLGATSEHGIGSLLVTNLPGGQGIEIDHVSWQLCEVPEPATGMMMLVGALAGLNCVRRRRG